MKTRFNYLIIGSLFISIALGLLYAPKAAVAADEIQSTNSALTVIPPKVELWAEQGKVLNQSLRITNESNDTALVALSTESFSITDGDGLVVLGQNFSLPNSLKDWIQFDTKAFQLGPKESKIVNYKINTPSDAYPGGSYAAIVVSMDKSDRKVEENAASARVVSLVMISVAGDIRDRAVVDSFNQNNYIKNDQNLFDFNLRVKNNGNNHIKPNGMIVITNIFGKKIGEIPLEEMNVLPNTYRDIKTTWTPKKVLFGRYNASLVSSYGYKNDKSLTAAVHFYVFPWRIVLLVLVFLALAATIVSRLKKINQKAKF